MWWAGSFVRPKLYFRLTKETKMENEIIQATENKKKKKEKFSLSSELFGWIEAFVYGLSLVVIINTFVICTSNVLGTSMVPTLNDGDRLLVSRMFYSEPQKEDVIVFFSYGYWDKLLVKRVIATEGDIVDIDVRTGNVLVNGEVLDEPYINEKIQFVEDVPMPYTVPKDSVFAMGDNRNHSTDSRSNTVGPVRKENILGKAIFKILPLKNIGVVK